MTKRSMLPLFCLCAQLALAQDAMEKMAPRIPRDAYQTDARAQQWSSDAEMWKALSEREPSNADNQLNWYRSERNARLQRNNGQLSPADTKALGKISAQLESTAPKSYQAELAAYYEHFPAPESFRALQGALATNPGAVDLVGPAINMAHLQGDKAAMDRWTAAMEKQGELSGAWAKAGSDLLRSVAPNGILFTNGDLDTHPTLVRQRRHDDRRDVLIVDQRLLADANYRTRMWKEAGGKGPVPAAGPEYARLLAKGGRSVHLAMSIDRGWIDALKADLSVSGVAFAVERRTTLAELDERWQGMHKPTNVPPLSNNYLVAGALLLQGLRTAGNETRAAQVEHELRGMAEKLGARNDLYRAGILQH